MLYYFYCFFLFVFLIFFFFFFNDTATTEIYTLSLHDALPIWAAGLRVGLGTDSPASTPSIDPWEELRTAVYTARARERRPDALGAADALRLATIDAARALALEDEIGSLAPRKRADLTILSLSGSPYDPVEDPTVGVVFGGSPAGVLETIVDGETRYRQGDSAWQEVRSIASAARRRMLA